MWVRNPVRSGVLRESSHRGWDAAFLAVVAGFGFGCGGDEVGEGAEVELFATATADEDPSVLGSHSGIMARVAPRCAAVRVCLVEVHPAGLLRKKFARQARSSVVTGQPS